MHAPASLMTWQRLALDRPQDALAALESAGRLLPDDEEILLYRGWALFALNRLADALVACERAIELAPDEAAAAQALRAYLLQALGRTEEALDACREALRLAPGNDEYRGLLNELSAVS